MTGSTARRRAWLIPLAIAVVAVVALAPLLPIAATPISADGAYSYFLPEAQYGNNLLGVASKAWTQLPNTASYGRIAPVSWTLQWLHYYAGYKIAVGGSIPLEIVNGVTRLLLLALVAWALHAFLRRVRVPGPVPAYLPRSLVRLVTLTAVLVFAAGARLDSPHRNALVAYPVFTQVAAVLAFAVPALVLGVMSRQVRRARWEPWLGTTLLVVAGLCLALSYELWYVAGVAGLAAAAFQPLPRDLVRVRRTALLGFGVPFVAGVAAVRVVLHFTTTSVYAGVNPAFGVGLLRTFAWNLRNSLPGGGGDVTARAAKARLPAPEGWTPQWALVALVGAAVVVTLAIAAQRTARRWSPDAGHLVVGWALRVVPTLLVTAVSAALVMAVSAQSQGAIHAYRPFRNYVITWGCSSAVVGVVLLVAVTQRRRVLGALGVAAVSAFLLVVGPIQAARIETWARIQYVTPPAPAIAAVYERYLHPDLTARGAAERCRVFNALGPNGYPLGFLRETVQESFEAVYGRPYCAHSTYPVRDRFPNDRADGPSSPTQPQPSGGP